MSVSNPLDSVHWAHYLLVLIKQTSCHICASEHTGWGVQNHNGFQWGSSLAHVSVASFYLGLRQRLKTTCKRFSALDPGCPPATVALLPPTRIGEYFLMLTTALSASFPLSFIFADESCTAYSRGNESWNVFSSQVVNILSVDACDLWPPEAVSPFTPRWLMLILLQ